MTKNVIMQSVNAEIDRFKAGLNALSHVDAERCGNWVWISGTGTTKHSQKLRKLGCKYSQEKKRWFYIPPSLPKGEQSNKHLSIEEIRKYHGSQAFEKAQASNKGHSSDVTSVEPFNLRDYLWNAISKSFMLLTVIYR